MAKITRTLKTTEMVLNTVGDTGLEALQSHVEVGHLSEEQIVKLSAKLSKKNGVQIVITGVEHKQEKRAIELSDFIEHSVVVEDGSEEEEEETETEVF